MIFNNGSLQRIIVFIALITLLPSCGKPTPEEVLTEFLSSLSSGECENAMKLSVNRAKNLVQGQIDSGCDPYPFQLHAVTCTVERDTATCICDETNQYGRRTWTYYLVQADGAWKVDAFPKSEPDFND